MKLRSIPDITHFIRVCCVLHNLAVDDDFPYKDEVAVHPQRNVLLEDEELNNRDDRNGIEKKSEIANILPL